MHQINNKTEEVIVDHLIDTLLAAGYSLGVNDGYLVTLHHSTYKKEIKEHMATTEEDYILVFDSASKSHVDWIHLVWGNEEDLICNHTLNKIKELMDDVYDFVEGYVSGMDNGVPA